MFSESFWDVPALVDVVELWDFTALDRLLSRDRFPRLCRVTIEIAVRRYKDTEAVDRAIAEVLPVLRAAGMLQVINLY